MTVNKNGNGTNGVQCNGNEESDADEISKTFSCPKGTEGRYIRVTRRTAKHLSLCEVEVYGKSKGR